MENGHCIAVLVFLWVQGTHLEIWNPNCSAQMALFAGTHSRIIR